MQSLLPGLMGFGPLYTLLLTSQVSRVGAGGPPSPQIPSPPLRLKHSGPCLLLLEVGGEKCGRTVPTQLTSRPRADPEVCTRPLRLDLALGASPGGGACGVPSGALMAGAGERQPGATLWPKREEPLGGAGLPGSSEVSRSTGLPRGSFSFSGPTPEPPASDPGLGPGSCGAQTPRSGSARGWRTAGAGGEGGWGRPGLASPQGLGRAGRRGSTCCWK